MDALQELGGAIQTLPDFTEDDVRRAQEGLGFTFDDDTLSTVTAGSGIGREGETRRGRDMSRGLARDESGMGGFRDIDGNGRWQTARGNTRIGGSSRDVSNNRTSISFDGAPRQRRSSISTNASSRYESTRYRANGRGRGFSSRNETDTESVAQTEDDVELPNELIYHSDDSDNEQQAHQDKDYDSDKEVWDMIKQQPGMLSPVIKRASNAPAGAELSAHKRMRLSQQRASIAQQDVVSPAGLVAADKMPDLFSYFKATSEDAKAAPDKLEKKLTKSKALKAEVNDGAVRNVDDYLEEAFSNIAVIASTQDSAEVDPQEIDRQIRRQKMKERTEYDTPDEFSDEHSENDALLQREKQFTEEFSDLVYMDNPILRDIKRSGKMATSFRRCMDVFRVYPYSVWSYLLSAIMIAIACIIYYWADSVPHFLLYNKGEADNYRALFLSENFLFYFRSLFSEQNRGALSIVTSLEVAISESGAYLQDYYMHGGSRTSLFLTGYVGRVLQLSAYSSVLAGLFTSAMSVAFIGVYLRILGQGKLVHQSRLYMLTRAPSIVLTFLWSQFQSVMFGTLKMWEWMLWNFLTFGVFFIAAFLLLEFLSDGLISMGLVFNVSLFVSVIGGIIVFSMPTFVKRHHSFNFAQDLSTIGRFSKMSLLTLCVGVWPIMLDFVYHTVKSAKSEDHMLAINVVNMPIALFLQYGMLFNGIALVVGARCVKRYRYDEFVFLVVKAVLNILCVIIVCLSLFFLSSMPSRSIAQIIGHHIANKGEEEDIVKRLTDLTSGMWHIGLFTVPVILFNNLYQTFLFCFERYSVLILVSIMSSLVVGVPGLFITLLKVESLSGWFYVQIAQNLLSLVVLVFVVHCYEMPRLQNAEIAEKMRRIDEENTRVIDLEDEIAI